MPRWSTAARSALFNGAPTGRGLRRLHSGSAASRCSGVVPSLVKPGGSRAAWKAWTGAASVSSVPPANAPTPTTCATDGARPGDKPVIEYCGGTEIGGGYSPAPCFIPPSPATFTTPALGLDVRHPRRRRPARGQRRVFLDHRRSGSPSTLLNRDHHEVYYAGTPTARGGTSAPPRRPYRAAARRLLSRPRPRRRHHEPRGSRSARGDRARGGKGANVRANPPPSPSPRRAADRPDSIVYVVPTGDRSH